MAQFTVNSERYESDGFVRIVWSGQTKTNHYSFRVYRQSQQTGAWELLRERVDLANQFSYDDYAAPSGTVFYSVVEVTTSGSNRIEEAHTPKAVQLETPYYWLVHPTDPSKSIQLRNITGDEFKEEREVEIKNIIGRGRKVDVGDSFGTTGTLTGRIYDRPGQTARQIRNAIENAKDTEDFYYLRNPFGDMKKIWFDDPSFSRIAGVGRSEYVEMSFAYYEVY